MTDKGRDLLVVTYHLPPSLEPQSILVGRLLDHLPRSYRLHVVAADDSAVRRDPALYGELRKTLADLLTVPYDASIGRMLFRKMLFPVFRVPDERVLWHWKAWKKLRELWSGKRFDALLTFAYPLSSNVMGLWLKKALGIPWIAFFSDPWVDSPYTNYRLLVRTANNALERRVMNAADMLVFASPEMRASYVRKYPFIEQRSTVLEHSFDPRQYPLPPADRTTRLTFRYLGSLNRVRTPTAMIRAVGELVGAKGITDRDACFEFYGGSDPIARHRMERMIRKYELERIILRKGSVPYQDSLGIMQGADVLVVIDADVPNSVFLPSKLIDYVGAGRPVLGITPPDSATARFIREIGGWVVSPRDANGFAEAFLDILGHYQRGTLDRFRPPRALQQRYTAGHHASQVTAMIESVMERTGSSPQGSRTERGEAR